jgi:hypothetical protein
MTVSGVVRDALMMCKAAVQLLECAFMTVSGVVWGALMVFTKPVWSVLYGRLRRPAA